MHTALSLEKPVAALEAEVARLTRELALLTREDKSNWIEKITGSFADRPQFNEVIRLSREYRKEQNELIDWQEEEQ